MDRLSCDRNLPCSRCMRAKRPERCSFKTRLPQPLSMVDQAVEERQPRNSDQIRGLQAEVAQLKTLLSEIRPQPEGNSSSRIAQAVIGHCVSGRGDLSHSQLLATQEPMVRNPGPKVASPVERVQSQPLNSEVEAVQNSSVVSHESLSDPRRRSPQVYYRQHSLFQGFGEVRGSHVFDRMCRLIRTRSHIFRSLFTHQRNC